MLAIILLAIEKYKNLLYRFSNNSKTTQIHPHRLAALKNKDVRKTYCTEISGVSLAERLIVPKVI
jgi:hypothetical protein